MVSRALTANDQLNDQRERERDKESETRDIRSKMVKKNFQ